MVSRTSEEERGERERKGGYDDVHRPIARSAMQFLKNLKNALRLSSDFASCRP